MPVLVLCRRSRRARVLTAGAVVPATARDVTPLASAASDNHHRASVVVVVVEVVMVVVVVVVAVSTSQTDVSSCQALVAVS